MSVCVHLCQRGRLWLTQWLVIYDSLDRCIHFLSSLIVCVCQLFQPFPYFFLLCFYVSNSITILILPHFRFEAAATKKKPVCPVTDRNVGVRLRSRLLSIFCILSFTTLLFATIVLIVTIDAALDWWTVDHTHCTVFFRSFSIDQQCDAVFVSFCSHFFQAKSSCLLCDN